MTLGTKLLIIATIVILSGLGGWMLKGNQVDNEVTKQLAIASQQRDSAKAVVAKQGEELKELQVKLDTVIQAAKARQALNEVKVHALIDSLHASAPDSTMKHQVDSLLSYHNAEITAMTMQLQAALAESAHKDTLIASQGVEIAALDSRVQAMTTLIASQGKDSWIWKAATAALAGVAVAEAVKH